LVAGQFGHQKLHAVASGGFFTPETRYSCKTLKFLLVFPGFLANLIINLPPLIAPLDFLCKTASRNIGSGKNLMQAAISNFSGGLVSRRGQRPNHRFADVVILIIFCRRSE
jgi:hypothetical protein